MPIAGTIGIIAHPAKPEAKEFATKLPGWLADKKHHNCEVISRLDEITKDYGLLIVLSGDGFVMGAASKLVSLGSPTPVMGINFGDQGFLTLADAEKESWEEVLTRVLRGDFVVQKRFALNVAHAGETFLAVNDAVIRHPDGMVILKVEVDGEMHYEELAADGIIAATPGGSPAYNRSAGGPIIMPTIDCFVVTPLESMAFHSKPAGESLIIDPRSEVRITLVDIKSSEQGEYPRLKKDGRRCLPDLHVGDSIVVSCSKFRSHWVSFGTSTFLKALREKAGIR